MCQKEPTNQPTKPTNQPTIFFIKITMGWLVCTMAALFLAERKYSLLASFVAIASCWQHLLPPVPSLHPSLTSFAPSDFPFPLLSPRFLPFQPALTSTFYCCYCYGILRLGPPPCSSQFGKYDAQNLGEGHYGVRGHYTSSAPNRHCPMCPPPPPQSRYSSIAMTCSVF